MVSNNQNKTTNIWLMLIATCLFTFMSTLDGSIVNIAIPLISKNLNIDMNKAEWIVSVYMLTICVFLILWGRISDIVGKIKIFRIGTIIFVIGSLLCGVSKSLNFLLLSRIIQALGASMTMATNYGIITQYFPANMRGRGLGIIGSFVSLGSIAGPGIGGFIIQNYSWHYIFLINIPVGIFAIILGHLAFPKEVKTNDKIVIDYKGFILYSISIISLFMGIFIGQEIGFKTPLVLALFLIFIVFLGLLVTIEKKVDIPLIDIKMFKNTKFSFGLLCAVLVFSSNLFFSTLMPFYLQNTRSLSSITSGMVLMSIPFAMIIVSPLSGALSDKIGSEFLTFVGLILIATTQLLFSFISINTSLTYFVVLAVVTGIGIALFQSPNSSLIMSAVEPNKLGIAGSLSSLARNLGMIVGISLSTTILYLDMTNQAGFKVTDYIEDRPDLFMHGMNISFKISFILCVIACCVTGYRLYSRKKVN